ncbi:MAG: hypothetical protein JSR86_07025 [Proteobacteria bacterium]|nr:hypothetical protein [Pseudomonadota bacterium]
MKPLKLTASLLALLAGAAALGGCVMPYHEENAALRMATPAAQCRALADYAAPNSDYPTVGGDILKNQNASFQAAPSQPTH